MRASERANRKNDIPSVRPARCSRQRRRRARREASSNSVGPIARVRVSAALTHHSRRHDVGGRRDPTRERAWDAWMPE